MWLSGEYFGEKEGQKTHAGWCLMIFVMFRGGREKVEGIRVGIGLYTSSRKEQIITKPDRSFEASRKNCRKGRCHCCHADVSLLDVSVQEGRDIHIRYISFGKCCWRAAKQVKMIEAKEESRSGIYRYFHVRNRSHKVFWHCLLDVRKSRGADRTHRCCRDAISMIRKASRDRDISGLSSGFENRPWSAVWLWNMALSDRFFGRKRKRKRAHNTMCGHFWQR